MATQANAPTGADYNAVFDASYDPNGGLRNGGVSDRLRDRLVREEHQRLNRQGWEPATIINLQPFPLLVNLGELGTLEIPAATPERPVQQVRIDRYRISMRDLGDGNFTPVSVLPAELAQEVQREYAETGGVGWFRGSGEPPAELIADARERQFAWWRKMFRQAVDSWSRYHQHKMITDRQRDAARELFRVGEVANLPDWVTITRAQADRMPCPMCGEDIKRTAKICHFCRTKIDDHAEEDAAATAVSPRKPGSLDVRNWQRSVAAAEKAVAEGQLPTETQLNAARNLFEHGIAELPGWAGGN